MTLGDLFERLALGELSQHTVGATGVIQTKDYPRIIAVLNVCLTALHIRFNLKENEVIIQQYPSLTEYRLSSLYAQTNTTSTEPIKYIEDTEEKPFKDDVLQVLAAFNEVGVPIPLNDIHVVRSIFTPEPTLIQMPYPIETNVLSIIYKANHPKIPVSTTDLTTLVDIPVSLEDALAALIASKVMVSAGNTTFAGLSSYFRAEYERCIDYVLRNNTLRSSDTDINIKFTKGGWV